MTEKINIKKLTETIKSQIKSYQEDIKLENVGTVASVGDGVVLAYGLEQATLGALVTFKSHANGLVIDLTENLVGIILLDKIDSVKEGDSVKILDNTFEIPVGKNFLGRTINPLGEPLDNGGVISYKEKRPVERKAYGVFERGPVNEPLTTGIMTIDSLIPIGKGQRELIIGDRQTGKTTIAIDTILNQKGKGVKCIYCAIGQKDATVAGIRQLLKEKGALDYTTIVLAGASASSTQLYLAPFAAVAMAEYFMEKGEDVLVVYDDLTKHAKAYREISLLLKRPPGREAYPGDIFYLHSRLLERSAKLSDKLKGGSITALPIIETQAGDISSYIPTNVISITDGQIFLEQELFYAGIRPAINSGLSVSRVGGRAQTKAIKSVAGTLRINLAAYRELEAFAQFGSDLDDASKFRLERGRKTIEILKQDIHELRDISYQAVILFALNNGFLDKISLEKIIPYTHFISGKLRTSVLGKDIADTILKTGNLPDKNKLINFLEENTKFFLN